MTVSEFIEQLRTLPPEAEVLVAADAGYGFSSPEWELNDDGGCVLIDGGVTTRAL